MEPLSREARREARIVEITLAVFLGAVIAVVPSVVLWLVGRALDVSGPGWATTRQTAFIVTVVAGADSRPAPPEAAP